MVHGQLAYYFWSCTKAGHRKRAWWRRLITLWQPESEREGAGSQYLLQRHISYNQKTFNKTPSLKGFHSLPKSTMHGLGTKPLIHRPGGIHRPIQRIVGMKSNQDGFIGTISKVIPWKWLKRQLTFCSNLDSTCPVGSYPTVANSRSMLPLLHVCDD